MEGPRVIKTNKAEQSIEIPSFLIAAIEIEKQTQTGFFGFTQDDQWTLPYVPMVKGSLVQPWTSIDEHLGS